jgi:ribosomal protein S18 acetylase RimI-like enzyme
MAVFETNVPQFFLPYEAEAFAEYLDEQQGAFYVVSEADRVVACGGYEIDTDEGEGWLCWLMVDRPCHRQGLGRALALVSLCALAQGGQVPLVRVDTHQHSRGFFERQGFVVEEEIVDGYGPGLNCYELSMLLDRARCDEIEKSYLARSIEWEADQRTSTRQARKLAPLA